MTETASTTVPRIPKGKGLKISRVFTTPGVHPYDEVTWGKRDVEQKNWKTGAVVFAQAGTEYPEFWSVNASTIVTTKYFRGAVGTPGRESSLKQLIDRVVDTYTAAGFANGYFGSDDDAEIFDHELKWMLLNQVFSFNSPVWFNVGTASPQQVAACFILAVDDTMDSILNWYREEGLIFKGGSGAGLNLSRIRSSKELLSSGGTASGPVSFMRGADSSAGTIKSGGATRRAAKMVVLDVDHPDIVEFVETKEREEHKIRALRDAGFDMDLGGADIISVQYQNANNSVRVSDEFMHAVEAGSEFALRGRKNGEIIETVDAQELWGKIAQAAWSCADPGIQYDGTINDWHTNPESGRITASNPCAEYMSLDNSSCNLASLNLMKFRRADGTFDAGLFTKVVELVITAMDISICFADFPTEPIGEITRAYRQLGIGFANLGALLMATGLAYDSVEGRTLAGAITQLMTGAAYRRSAELAGVVGPYEGFARNADGHRRVMRKHQTATGQLVRTIKGEHVDRDGVVGVSAPALEIAEAALAEWDRGEKIGAKNGYRNAQASVIAPTGCIVPGSLVTTDRGLARLGGLGNPDGDQWQDIDLQVATDEGPRPVSKFFVNGLAETRRIVTAHGHVIQGTPEHRIKTVDTATGQWQWSRFGDLKFGDIAPLQLGTMVGVRRRVVLPVADQAYYTNVDAFTAPDAVTPELAMLVGYFMGAGSLHSDGLRLAVDGQDPDVNDTLGQAIKSVFRLENVITEETGSFSLAVNSVRLSRWWAAAGFAKTSPSEGHAGGSWVSHVPAAILETNDPGVYAAFLSGLFEADGSANLHMPNVDTTCDAFADDIRTLLLALGFPTMTQRLNGEDRMGRAGVVRVRLRDREWNEKFIEQIGFMSSRKSAALRPAAGAEETSSDFIYLPAVEWERLLALVDGGLRAGAQQSLRRNGAVSRHLAHAVLNLTGDRMLEQALGYLFELVVSNEDGGEQFTYDLSVPANVTYVANGFVSHNTIGFMMDCDTTGLEPDLALVKFKKLVGGSSMEIANQQVAPALLSLGYTQEIIEAIEEYIVAEGHVVDAPGLRPEHYDVFDCAMGDRAISWNGHVLMMAAIQPGISGALSKTVNLPTEATVDDIADVYLRGWKLGLKALAVYRDNCKVGQPLSVKGSTSSEAAGAPTAPAVEAFESRPERKRLPKKRASQTVSFEVAGAEGYMTASAYPEGELGEVFLKMSKQGSTLAGVMDAFSISLSLGLQYGVPLEAYVSKFVNMRFDPAGPTDDDDIRLAQSIVDYLFRRLALDYLPFDVRAQYGIFTVDERKRATENGGTYEPIEDMFDVEGFAQSVPAAAVKKIAAEAVAAVTTAVGAAPPAKKISAGLAALAAMDAPICMTCGVKMRPAGACFVCAGDPVSGSGGCGSTSGCS